MAKNVMHFFMLINVDNYHDIYQNKLGDKHVIFLFSFFFSIVFSESVQLLIALDTGSH